jgi:hypothetical protein
VTTCPHCKNWSWKLNEINVSGAAFRYYTVQCSSCDAPIGPVEFTNIGAKLEQIEKKIDNIAANVGSIANVVSNIANRMR